MTMRAAFSAPEVEPLQVTPACAGGLRRHQERITEMDIYGRSGDIRLDERKLSQDLGVSRTRFARR